MVPKSIDIKSERKDVDDDILTHPYITFSRAKSVKGEKDDS
jgi:hypothetical protein